jgi:fatty acid desaturase
MDKVQNTPAGKSLPGHVKRGRFAVGYRRVLDWLDWIVPEAWDVEHNKEHHYFLSEEKEPDLVERNFEVLHHLPIPMFLKYASMFFWVFNWKLTYYSPNTFKELQLSKKGSFLARNWPKSIDRMKPLTVGQSLEYPLYAAVTGNVFEIILWIRFWTQWVLAMVPMATLVAFPALVPLALGAVDAWPFAVEFQTAARRALITSLMAEGCTNAHAFIIIACNHSGNDMWRYETSCRAYSAEWFLRCAYSSTNFETGNDFIDVMYGWLNYQIEHHMFPDMTPLQYRKLQPLIKSVCKKHGVQYIQQNALKRTWKMLRVAVGAESMQRCVSLLPQESDNKRKSACPGIEGGDHQPKRAKTMPATSEMGA